MGKFILTESDKNEIRKMYGLNEQEEPATNEFTNKKFNVYSDPQNSKFKFAVTINNVSTPEYPQGAKITGINSETSKDVELYFDCTKNDRLATSKSVNIMSYYSQQLTKALTGTYCQKNKSGRWVPRADYASTGTGMDSNLA